MNARFRSVTSRAAMGCVFALALAMLPLPAFGAVGDLLRTLNVPSAAQCGGYYEGTAGSALAIVQGFKVGFPQYPVLLVTACADEGVRVSFLNPSLPFEGSTAELVATIFPSVTPASLALRGNKGDFLACVDGEGSSLYTIGLDGTATALGIGVANCEGIAWDASDSTIYGYRVVSETVRVARMNGSTGATLADFARPCATSSGLAIGGGSLFVACQGGGPGPVAEIRQLRKSDLAALNPPRSFSTAIVEGGTSYPEDLECDQNTFGAKNKDVIWTIDGDLNELFAYEIPGGTCGSSVGDPVAFPGGVCPIVQPNADGSSLYYLSDGTPKDTDGDGLLDCWEDLGIDYDGNGTIDYVIPNANKLRKNIYLEIDYMQFHQPSITNVINPIIAAFANAPVTNPDNTTGITLTVQVSDQFAHNNNIAFEPCTPPAAAGSGIPNFDERKTSLFGTLAERTTGTAAQITARLNAKRLVFHYMTITHNMLGNTRSGCAEVWGNDAVVSLGSFTLVAGHRTGSSDEQRGAIMHELGHNLNLLHGGHDDVNCKPNYLSLMSYSRQNAGKPVPNRRLDYSRANLGDLDKGNLIEALGLGLGNPTLVGDQTAFGPGTAVVVPADQPIDWDRSNPPDPAVTVTPPVQLNQIPNSGCDGSGPNVLEGHDDWANLQYNFRASPSFADGVSFTAVEITAEQAEALYQAADLNADGIGDAVACGGVACAIDVVPFFPNNVVLLFPHDGELVAIVPVGILSRPGFDARQVIKETATLDGFPVLTKFGVPLCVDLDINRDGLKDRVCTFALTRPGPGRDVLLLEASTFTGISIRDQDSVQFVLLGGGN